MGVSSYTPPSERIVHGTEVDFQARTQLGTTIHIVQYDKSLPVIAAALYSGGQPYKIPTGAEMNVRVGKPDGTKVYNPVLGCNAARTICYFEVTQQMSAAYGQALAILEVIVNGNLAGSSYIPIEIARNPAQEDAIISSDEYKSMNEIVEEAREALGKPPKIQNENWWLWDSDKKTYVDSGSPARGETGKQGEQGETGKQGEQGETGKQGPEGKQGIQGEQGETGNGIASTELNDDYTLTIHFTDGTSYTTPPIRGVAGPEGKQGVQGETGRGFKVLGYYETESTLSSAVTAPEAGDAYGVGTAEPYDIYIWDGVSQKWVNNGALQGAQGPEGKQGIQGIQGPAGKTPVAGVDYFTEADKAEMVNSVYALITDGDNAAYGS